MALVEIQVVLLIAGEDLHDRVSFWCDAHFPLLVACFLVESRMTTIYQQLSTSCELQTPYLQS